MLGLVCAAVGLLLRRSRIRWRSSRSRSCRWRFGIGFGHPTMSSLVSQVARGDEQGRVQGAASAVESLGRTIGPVWGKRLVAASWRIHAVCLGSGVLLLTLLLTPAARHGIEDCRNCPPGDRRKPGADLASALVRPDQSEQAAQAVQRLNHRSEQGSVAAVARENLANGDFEPAD